MMRTYIRTKKFTGGNQEDLEGFFAVFGTMAWIYRVTLLEKLKVVPVMLA